MLTGSYPVQAPNELQPKPGYGETISSGFERPFYQMGGLLSQLGVAPSDPEAAKKYRQNISETLNVLDSTLNDPRLGYTQSGLDAVSEIAGSLIPFAPLGAVGGAVGAGAARLAGVGLRAVLPEIALTAARTPLSKLGGSLIGDYLPHMSPSQLATGLSEAFGGYKGFTIPDHVMNNYHASNDTLDMKNAISEWSNDNYGLMVPAGIFAMGYLGFKIHGVNKSAQAYGELSKQLVAEHLASRSTREEFLKNRLKQANQINDQVTEENAANLGGQARKIAEQYKNYKEQSSKYKINRADIIKQKLEKLQAKTRLEESIDESVKSGRISAKQGRWYLDNIEQIKTHDQLNTEAYEVLNDNEVPYDRATGRVYFQILDQKSLKNFKNAFAHEISSGFTSEQNKELSSYIVNNSMDAVRSTLIRNPSILAGHREVIDYISNKLRSQKKVLQEADSLLNKYVFGQKPNIFDKEQFPYLNVKQFDRNHLDALKRLYEIEEFPKKFTNPEAERRFFLNSIREKYPNLERELNVVKGDVFSEESIYRHIKERRLSKNKIPFTLPRGVKEILSLERKMNRAKTLEERREIYGLYKYHQFQSIPRELEAIRNRLVDDIKSNKKYKNSEDYSRLSELSDYRADAKQVLDRINLEQEYKKQSALAKSLDQFIKTFESTASRFSDPNQVSSYLKNQIEAGSPLIRDEVNKLREPNLARIERSTLETQIPLVKVAENLAEEEISHKKSALDQIEKEVEESGEKEITNEFKALKEKHDQLMNNESAINKAVECAWSALNGEA